MVSPSFNLKYCLALGVSHMDVHADLSQPKSIVFSPDGGRVYIGQYGSSSILAFDISMPSSIGCTPIFLLVFLIMNICFLRIHPSSDIFFDTKKKSNSPLLTPNFAAGSRKELLPYSKGAITPSAETTLAGLSSVTLIGTDRFENYSAYPFESGTPSQV